MPLHSDPLTPPVSKYRSYKTVAQPVLLSQEIGIAPGADYPCNTIMLQFVFLLFIFLS